MSLIDPKLFKDEPEAGGERPFGAHVTETAPSGAGFKDLRRQTIVTIVLMALAIVANLAFDVVGAVEDPEGDAFGAAALVYLLFAAVGFVAMLVWFYRATKNARAISNGLQTKPGWAVGYFFIPILSLFRPYRTMSEIWRSAMSPLSWKVLHDPITLRLWWGGWLVGALAGSLAARMEPATGPITILATVVGGAADILFCVLAWRIAVAQVENKDQSVFD